MLCKDLKGFQTCRPCEKNSPLHDGRLSHQLHQATGTMQISSTSPHENANPAGGHLTLSAWCWVLKEIKDKCAVICHQPPSSQRAAFCQSWKCNRNTGMCPPGNPLTLSGINLCLKLLQHQLRRLHGLISGFLQSYFCFILLSGSWCSL